MVVQIVTLIAILLIAFWLMTQGTFSALVMAACTLVSTIIALAFGGGGDPDSFGISDIHIVLVNQDDGLNMSGAVGIDEGSGVFPAASLFGFGNEQDGEIDNGGVSSFNAGNMLVTILAPESAAADETTPTLSLPECTLVAGTPSGSGFDTTLEELFVPATMDEPALAREAVQEGEYVAAIIIPRGFSQTLLPINQLALDSDEPSPDPVAVEVFTNAGNPIEASVVNAVVEGIVGQFGRMGLAIFSLSDTVGQSLVASLDVSALDALPSVLLSCVCVCFLPAV